MVKIWKPLKKGLVHCYQKQSQTIRWARHSSEIKDLANSEITIFSNNCLAGILYHDYRLRFLSPTINLWFADLTSFLLYADHFSEYLGQPITECHQFSYPSGIIHGKSGLPDILLHFMHYSTFDEAVMKWNERSRRINPKNIRVVLDAPDCDFSQEACALFDALSYPKVMISNELFSYHTKGPLFIQKNFGDSPRYHPTSFRGLFGGRNYDLFNAYEFLKEGTVSK